MELTNEFTVGVPVSEAWAVLTDVERIAPCMPGAELQEVQGDEYRGIVKVKVGPITAQYKGKAVFVERDESGGKVVLRAEGRDTRGQGNANATMTATLVPDGSGTKVTVSTDLAVTGKVAQFGRGVMADVSAKLLGQFVDCLENNVLGAPATGEAAAAPAPAPAPAAGASDVNPPIPAAATNGPGPAEEPPVRRIQSAPAQPVDLLDAAGGSVAKRAIPAVVAALLVILLLRRRRRRHR